MRPRLITRRRLGGRAFTLVEMLLVVAMIMLLTLLAYPSLRTFSARNADTGVASDIARLLNKARDQSRRRNRAYVMEFRDFGNASPVGRLVIREGHTSSCQASVVDLNSNSRLIKTVPFGQTPQGSFVGHVTLNVGLMGWVAAGENLNQVSRNALSFCFTPDGAMHKVNERAVSLLSGRPRVLVQRFAEEFEGGWIREGPPRTVEFSFAGGARLGIN